MKSRALTLLLSASMLGGLQAMAESVHYTVTVPAGDLNFSPPTALVQGVNLPKFDPGLGTLTAVHVTLSSTLSYNSTVLTFQSQDATFQYDVDCGLGRPDGTTLVMDSLAATEQATLPMFAPSFFSGAANGSQSVVLSGAADLALFSGSGDVTLMLAALGGHTISATFPTAIMDNTGMQYGAQVDVTYDYDVVSVVDLAVDVKPGSDSNPVNLKSHGVLPVAVLSTADCNALDLDVATLRLGDPGLSGLSAPVKASAEDVNGDGVADLVLHFSTDDLVAQGAIGANSTRLALSGALQNGTPAVGADAVSITPGSSKGKGK